MVPLLIANFCNTKYKIAPLIIKLPHRSYIPQTKQYQTISNKYTGCTITLF